MIISKNKINSNLRRAAFFNLIALLSQSELNELSAKYYGIYENEKLVGFRCPYSGEEIRDYDVLVLEHIIPISSKGGTVLFNCVPAHVKVNSTDEKGAKHLLSWWLTSKYWNDDAPTKLCTLLDYIFEGYEKVFSKHTVSELIDSHNNVIYELDNYEEGEYERNYAELIDSEVDAVLEDNRLQEQIKSTGLITYLQFLNDCISVLKQYGIDVSKYESKLSDLSENGIFEEIERYTMFQNVLRRIIKDKVGQNSRSYFTFGINFDIKSLVNSMYNFKSEEEIYNEISNRMNNLQIKLEERSISIISYFEDLINLRDVDIMFKSVEDVTIGDIDLLVQKIDLCVADKFQKLIEWFDEYRVGNPKVVDRGLGYFFQAIKSYDLRCKKFFTKLDKYQYDFISKSEDKRLMLVYEEMVLRALLYEIKDFIGKNKDNEVFISISKKYLTSDLVYDTEKIKLRLDDISTINRSKSRKSSYIQTDNVKEKFELLIQWFSDNEYGVPNINTHIGRFRQKIVDVNKNQGFATRLTSEQMKILKNSNDVRLIDIYKEILIKSILFNVNTFEDEQFFIEFKNSYLDENGELQIDVLNKELQNINVRKNNLGRSDVEKNVKVFDELLNWLFNENNIDILPNKQKADEREMADLLYRMRLVRKDKDIVTFRTIMPFEKIKEIIYSDDIRLQLLYEELCLKALLFNMSYFIKQNQEVEKFKLLKEYYSGDGILDKNRIEVRIKEIQSINKSFIKKNSYKQKNNTTKKFDELVQWYKDNPAGNPDEKEFTSFRRNINYVENGHFRTVITKEQLLLLATSSDKRLNDIYIEAVLKSFLYDIVEFKEKNRNIELYHILKSEFCIDGVPDVSKINDKLREISYEKFVETYAARFVQSEGVKEKFEKLVDWYNNNTRIRPNSKSKDDVEERKIGIFLTSIKKLQMYLTGEQYCVLSNSQDDRLKLVYEEMVLNFLLTSDKKFFERNKNNIVFQNIVEKYTIDDSINIEMVNDRLEQIRHLNKSLSRAKTSEIVDVDEIKKGRKI